MCFIPTLILSSTENFSLLPFHCMEWVIHMSIIEKIVDSTIKLYYKTKWSIATSVCWSRCCKFLVYIMSSVFWEASVDKITYLIFITKSNIWWVFLLHIFPHLQAFKALWKLGCFFPSHGATFHIATSVFSSSLEWREWHSLSLSVYLSLLAF